MSNSNAQTTHQPRLEILPLASLVPNTYNPNTMGAREYEELVAEVRHLGRLPKPTVVTREDDRWVIIDGEHGWRAAQQVGLSAITCEIIEVDTFESMRQTFKRNQHGRHHPVRLGRMFEAMMQDRGVSQRQLATEIDISEGSIRNALAYSHAVELRNGYAREIDDDDPAWADQEIGRLQIRQVRAYLSLPALVRDAWLDAGANLKDLDRALAVRSDLDGKPETTYLSGADGEIDFWQELVEAGLAERVNSADFVGSAHEAFRLLLFRRRYARRIENLDAYLRAIVDSGQPSSLTALLPCRATDGRVEVLLLKPEQNWSPDFPASCHAALVELGRILGRITRHLDLGPTAGPLRACVTRV